MNGVRSSTFRRPRVYTLHIVLLVLLLALARDARSAEMLNLTVEPAMVKGPANAPVTIVEFSDYQ